MSLFWWTVEIVLQQMLWYRDFLFCLTPLTAPCIWYDILYYGRKQALDRCSDLLKATWLVSSKWDSAKSCCLLKYFSWTSIINKLLNHQPPWKAERRWTRFTGGLDLKLYIMVIYIKTSKPAMGWSNHRTVMFSGPRHPHLQMWSQKQQWLPLIEDFPVTGTVPSIFPHCLT